ncbi:MAG: hypothetical protein GF355_07155, partial [Candidatus Eisenbacteria bacterium]|nr:hypothetical protein [Candidatus Eisenbacteria bacterium]
MKEFFRTFFAVVVAQLFLCFCGLVIVLAIVALATSDTVDVPRDAYLIQDISGEIPEYRLPTSLTQLGEKPMHLTAILENLEKAREDERIRGVILKIGPSTMGFAKRGEIRDRIRRLQEAGKPVYAYSRLMQTSDYYLVSGCDSIFIPPEGMLEFHGFAAEVPFVKGTLDAIGVRPNVDYIAEYKSAVEPFIREEMSPEARENLLWMLNPIFDDMVAVIAGERNMSPEQVVKLMEGAIYNAPHARELGLLDATLYWEDLETVLNGGDEWKTISAGDYAEVERKSVGLGGKPRVAVVHAQGVIAGGENGFAFPFGLKMGSATMTRVLDEIRDDSSIDAVIMRIDSNGGESIASDEIGYALSLVEEEKPVLVSMVDVAASGGYMISYQCSTVVAHEHTLTGSIGSITGKFNLRGLYHHLGIRKDFVTVGPRSRIYSDYRDFTEEEREIVRKRHWASYDTWVRRISEMRNIPYAAMDTLARGRVWTGEQALER